MERSGERDALRERYVLAMLEAVQPLQQQAADPEVTLELLIEAAGLLLQRLERELAELREEQAD